jgi:hypothetical protein
MFLDEDAHGHFVSRDPFIAFFRCIKFVNIGDDGILSFEAIGS